MSKVRVQLSAPKPGQEQRYLVFRETQFNAIGIATSQKMGLLEIDARNFNADEILEKAQTLNWELSSTPDTNGFYAVTQVEGVAAEEEKSELADANDLVTR